jgi:putative DNA primase/helicase
LDEVGHVLAVDKRWLLGGHRLEVGAGGVVFWHWMRLISFERVVSEEDKVDNLADILVSEEGPGISRASRPARSARCSA